MNTRLFHMKQMRSGQKHYVNVSGSTNDHNNDNINGNNNNNNNNNDDDDDDNNNKGLCFLVL